MDRLILLFLFISFVSDIKCTPQGRQFNFNNGRQQNNRNNGQTMRLTAGQAGVHEGFLEILPFRGGRWQLVCNDDFSWNKQESDVACRQMGYDSANFFKIGQNTFADFRKIDSQTNTFADTLNIQCQGNEDTLDKCKYSENRGNQCDKSRHAVALVCQQCQAPSQDIGCLRQGKKYLGSASQTRFGEKCLHWNTPGLLQLFADQGDWNHNYCRNSGGGADDIPICYVDESNYDECEVPICSRRYKRDRNSICSPQDRPKKDDPFLGPLLCHKEHDFQCRNNACIDINNVCNGQSQCADGSDEDRNLCSKPFDIKLVGGPNERTGRVLVRHRGVWGTVCDDHFGDEEARVVCRMLRFPSRNAKVYDKGTDYDNKGPIWIKLTRDDDCKGNESHLNQCKQSYLWEHDYECSHSEDVAVTCE